VSKRVVVDVCTHVNIVLPTWSPSVSSQGWALVHPTDLGLASTPPPGPFQTPSHLLVAW
jgi:hypothetical protein